jgi:RNA polymerase sigma factor (TIGR02999 family)
MSGRAPSLDTASLRELLEAMARRDPAAQAKLVDLFYADFHRLARNMSRSSETMRPTVLANEMFLKLISAGQLKFEDRKHFHHLAACMMRNILRDYYRKRSRGPTPASVVPVEEWDLIAPKERSEFLEVDEALERLEKQYPRKAQVVMLRIFGGRSVAETAEALNITQDRVNRDFAQARVFLRRQLLDSPPQGT